MKKATGTLVKNYLRQIKAADKKNTLAGIRIDFSQDTRLAWSEFMTLYNAYAEKQSEIGR